jgi:hypothetical protein
MDTDEHGWGTSGATEFWTAAALSRFSTVSLATPKRQRAAAVQNLAEIRSKGFIRVHLCPSVVDNF